MLTDYELDELSECIFICDWDSQDELKNYIRKFIAECQEKANG